MLFIRSRVGRWLVLTWSLGLLFIGLASLYLWPPTVNNQMVGEATATMQVWRPVLLHNGQCTDVTWQTENIEAIFYNNHATIGEATQPYCPASSPATRPYLLIYTPGGGFMSLSGQVTILAEQPVFWLALVVTSLLLLAAFIPIPQVQENPTRRQFVGYTLAGLGLAALGLGGWATYQQQAQTPIECDGWLLYPDDLRQETCEND